jgi:hypothetical protein
LQHFILRDPFFAFVFFFFAFAFRPSFASVSEANALKQMTRHEKNGVRRSEEY